MGILEDSSSYQLILEEAFEIGVAKGRLESLHTLLIRLGAKRFGLADDSTKAALTAIVELERLRRMMDRLLDVASWAELLATT